MNLIYKIFFLFLFIAFPPPPVCFYCFPTLPTMPFDYLPIGAVGFSSNVIPYLKRSMQQHFNLLVCPALTDRAMLEFSLM